MARNGDEPYARGAAPLGVKVERSVDRHVSPAGMGVVPKDARKEMPRGSTIIPPCLAALVLVAGSRLKSVGNEKKEK